jgi:hypothetical protein
MCFIQIKLLSSLRTDVKDQRIHFVEVFHLQEDAQPGLPGD